MISVQRVFPVVVVYLAVSIAAEAISNPSLAELLRSRAGSGARVSTASVQDDYGYEQYGIETKELCLQESEMKTCGWAANCVDDDDTVGDNIAPVCVTGQFWTSDFACCREQKYGYDSPGGLRHSQLWSSSASIGTCDWTVSYVDFRNLDQGTTAGSTDITGNIAKLGTAWATCYLGPDSDACGGPLCDRMVMSLQGTVYRATTAYSHWGPSTTATNPLCVTVNGPVDDEFGTGPSPGRVGGPTTTPAGRVPAAGAPVNIPAVSAPASPAAAPAPANTPATAPTEPIAAGTVPAARAPANIPAVSAPATAPSAPIAAGTIPAARAPANTPVRTASIGDASLQYNRGQYGHYDSSSTNMATYKGQATIIMGIINGMAGQHKEKWDEGVFEYVPYYGPVSSVGAAEALDPGLPWVRDKTYKMTFYRGAKR